MVILEHAVLHVQDASVILDCTATTVLTGKSSVIPDKFRILNLHDCEVSDSATPAACHGILNK